MSKHTSGPWEVKPSSNEIVNADHGRLPFAIVADFTLIGALYENGADARLIASAPDLLQALLSLCADELLTQDKWDDARAAIAKATGEQT